MLIGILGGGQLGRMLALAGYPLGMRFRFLDPSPYAPAGHVGDLVVGDYTDPAALERFARGLDVATWEFENVPLPAAAWLAQRVPVYPPPKALEVGQDRLAEKAMFRRVGMDVHPFLAVESAGDLARAAREIGLPLVLKTRRGGYDGKGQGILRTSEDAGEAWRALGGAPLIAEQYVPFDREVSVIGVRGIGGATGAYPIVENVHREGILRTSRVPMTSLAPSFQERARAHAASLMEALDYVGVLAIEFFVAGDRLLANEFAPRVHNSGHWTIEGAVTSQFENHVRAIAGLPLGSTALRGVSTMVNLIGSAPAPADVARIDGAHLHLYGKQPRAGRKIGHVTINGEDPAAVQDAAARVIALTEGGKS